MAEHAASESNFAKKATKEKPQVVEQVFDDCGEGFSPLLMTIEDEDYEKELMFIKEYILACMLVSTKDSLQVHLKKHI